MKNYKKTYEDVLTSQRRKNKCKIEYVSTDIGLSFGEYCDLFRKTVVDFENSTFEKFVKVDWLRHRFCYYGRRRIKNRNNGGKVDYAYGIFMNNYIGVDMKLFTKNIFFYMSTYFNDFFPNFDQRDPFKEKFVYPYKHMRFAHLALVHQMTERLELLDHGEKKGMLYSEFADYVINYAYCFNDDNGKEIYRVIPNRHNGGYLVVKLIGNKPYHDLVKVK